MLSGLQANGAMMVDESLIGVDHVATLRQCEMIVTQDVDSLCGRIVFLVHDYEVVARSRFRLLADDYKSCHYRTSHDATSISSGLLIVILRST